MTTSVREAALRHASYLRHRERILEKAAAFRESKREILRLRARADQANRRYPGKITAEDIQGVFDRGNKTCVYCGKSNLVGHDLTIEHLQPINDVRYLAVSCFACNAARIPRHGSRKTAEEKAALHLEREKARWHTMSDEQREQRRAYMREYKRKRRLVQ